MLEKHVIPILGHISLTSLKPEHVRHLIKTMEDSKVGVVSIKHSKDALSCILREAVKLEYIHRNVARLVDYKVEKQREIKVWNSEQAATFLSNSKEHRLYPLFAVMFQYGLRRGEIMGLTWNDIDFDTGTIHIRQQLLYVDNQRFVQPTKSKAGLRALPMTANIREILLCHKETESAQVYKDDFVFHTIKGNPLDPRALLTTFKYLAEAAGLPKLTLHEIRHTVATLLKDAGVSPRDAQMILGHSDITTTLRIYTHCSWESTQEALTRIAV
jgi:integrase